MNKCGMSRNAKGLKEAIAEIKELRKDFKAKCMCTRLIK